MSARIAQTRQRDMDAILQRGGHQPRLIKCSEPEYLSIQSNLRCEFDNGILEVLPMPMTSHQMILAVLFRLLDEYFNGHDLGTTLFTGVNVQLWPGKYCQPDIAFMATENADRIHEEYWEAADLVVEVVSPDAKSRRRDLKDKRLDYAKSGIGEYWIVDPKNESITVLTLNDGKYSVHGVFGLGETARSAKWRSLKVPVSAVLTIGGRGLPR